MPDAFWQTALERPYTGSPSWHGICIYRARSMENKMKSLKMVPVAFMALLWVNSVAHAEEAKPFTIHCVSVGDISNIGSTFVQAGEPKVLSLSKEGFAPSETPKKAVQVFKTEEWMNVVQMNANSVFVQLRF